MFLSYFFSVLISEHRLTWSDWSGWGECSASCGNGYQIRNRGCKDTVTNEDRPDSDCYGSDIEYQTCPYKDCPRKLSPLALIVIIQIFDQPRKILLVRYLYGHLCYN